MYKEYCKRSDEKICRLKIVINVLLKLKKNELSNMENIYFYCIYYIGCIY